MYPELVERLNTIASAPNLIVLVLNPLPSRTKQHVLLLTNNLPFIKTKPHTPKTLKGNTSYNKMKIMGKQLNMTRIPSRKHIRD